MMPRLPSLRDWFAPLLLLASFAVFAAAAGDGAAPRDERAESQPRSPLWPKVREAHLEQHPACEACGQKDDLQVHHIIPFSHDPSKELDPANLITLCTDGVGHCDCHLLIGHGGNFRCRNDNVVRDAKRFRRMLTRKVCIP